MKTKIETFCEELTQKSNKKITFETEEIIPNVNGGENYRLFADGTKTKVILSENNITNNTEERNELINMVCEHF